MTGARVLFCGTTYNVPTHEGDGPLDRAIRLINSFKDEDLYKVEQAAAAAAWLHHSGNRSPEEGERRRKRRQARTYQRGKEKLTPEQKLRHKLTEEVGELYRRWHKQMEAKYGRRFDHIIELERETAAEFYEYRPAADELRRWRAWAALEEIVFGDALPETAERVAEYEEKAAAEEAEKQRR